MAEDRAESDDRKRKLFTAKRTGDVEYLTAALRDPELRHAAAQFLADVGNRRSAPALFPLLSASEDSARVAAIRALASLRVDEAVPKLKELSCEGSFLVRSWAIVALGDIGGSSAVHHLIGLLDDPNPRARRLAAKALGKAGDAVVTEPIRRAMQKDAWYRRKTYRQAIRALASRRGAG